MKKANVCIVLKAIVFGRKDRAAHAWCVIAFHCHHVVCSFFNRNAVVALSLTLANSIGLLLSCAECVSHVSRPSIEVFDRHCGRSMLLNERVYAQVDRQTHIRQRHDSRAGLIVGCVFHMIFVLSSIAAVHGGRLPKKSGGSLAIFQNP